MSEIKKVIDLNIRQLLVLKFLAKNGPSKLIDLSREAQCTSAGITNLRDKLERLSFIQEVKVSEDRRATYVGLTEEGTKVLKLVAETFAV
jgi:DNA-binding MarR family transcriptional regulator